jgi:tryptophanyl-tRNA synthetase
VLPEARAIIPRAGRLPSIDGKAKMSKSAVRTFVLSAALQERPFTLRQKTYIVRQQVDASNMCAVEVRNDCLQSVAQ